MHNWWRNIRPSRALSCTNLAKTSPLHGSSDTPPPPSPKRKRNSEKQVHPDFPWLAEKSIFPIEPIDGAKVINLKMDVIDLSKSESSRLQVESESCTVQRVYQGSIRRGKALAMGPIRTKRVTRENATKCLCSKLDSKF